MTKKIFTITLGFIFILVSFNAEKHFSQPEIISYTVDVNQQDLQFFWKDEKGNIFRSIQNLKDYLDHKNIELLFATNGGMYKQGFSPQGLFIEKQKVFSPIDTFSGNGNFYLKPNGIFYVTTDNKAIVCETSKLFHSYNQIKYATQSGPMLLIDGVIHQAFQEGSANVNIRNGVGILPDGKIVFAMSKDKINFYNFAQYFKTLGCKQALYLDGFVSRTYLPEKNWIQKDGNFGVIIGVVKHKN